MKKKLHVNNTQLTNYEKNEKKIIPTSKKERPKPPKYLIILMILKLKKIKAIKKGFSKE